MSNPEYIKWVRQMMIDDLEEANRTNTSLNFDEERMVDYQERARALNSEMATHRRDTING